MVAGVPTLQTMTAPDFDAARIRGGRCLWRSSQEADHLLAFNATSGVVKDRGSYVRMLPEASSGTLRYGTRRVYRGGGLTVTVTGGEGAPLREEEGSAEWVAGLTVRNDAGAQVVFDKGLLSCHG